MGDRLHMLLSVSPKYSIANTIGYLKGKSAIRIHRDLIGVKGTLFGRSFWACGYCVSTVGLDEARIREYIKNQEKLEKQSPRTRYSYVLRLELNPWRRRHFRTVRQLDHITGSAT